MLALTLLLPMMGGGGLTPLVIVAWTWGGGRGVPLFTWGHPLLHQNVLAPAPGTMFSSADF